MKGSERPQEKELARWFGKRLQELRRERGFTSQLAFAVACGLSPGTLASIESGKSLPNFATLLQISRALKTSIESLLPAEAASAVREDRWESAWNLYADLHPYVIRESSNVAEMDMRGNALMTLAFLGISVKPDVRSPFVLQNTTTLFDVESPQSTISMRGARFEFLEKPPRGVRYAFRRESARLGVHRIFVDPAALPTGKCEFSYRLRFAVPKLFDMAEKTPRSRRASSSAKRASLVTIPAGAGLNGSWSAIEKPILQTTIEVQFPGRYRPLHIDAHAWLPPHAYPEAPQDLTARFKEASDVERRPARWNFDYDALSGKAALVLFKPLPHVNYGVFWQAIPKEQYRLLLGKERD